MPIDVVPPDPAGSAATGDLPRPPRGGGPLDALRRRGAVWIEWFGLGRLAAIGVTVVVAVLGGWWLLRPAAAPTEAGLPYAGAPPASGSSPTTPAATARAATVPAATIVVVHVAGAVVAPGVYELPPGARVHGAVEAAGGSTADADPSALNLAAPLVDGERVYVPVVGESVPPPLASPGLSTASAAPAAPIDVNRAGEAELDQLPGIGPATAAAIVAHREANGPFATVEDLEAVRGIGPAKLDAIRDLVTL